MSDFYTRLSVKLLRICEQSRRVNGGLVSIEEIIKYNNQDSRNAKVNEDDVRGALKHLEALGTGCKVIGGGYLSTSPFVMPGDVGELLKINEKHGRVNANLAAKEAGWTKDRFEHSIVSLQGITDP